MSQIPPGMLLRLISGKKQIITNYASLIPIAPSNDERMMIEGILSDEKTHLMMFTALYAELFGEEPPAYDDDTVGFTDYREGLNTAILTEFSTYTTYGNIVFTDSSNAVLRVFKRAVFDENIHSTRFSYLLQKLNHL